MPADKIYIELSDALDNPKNITDVMIVSFYNDRLLLLKRGPVHEFPRARFERAEAIEKTVRRELYEQTGAFLGRSELLGLFKFASSEENKEVPIYLGIIDHFESPVLNDAGKKKLVSVDNAARSLQQDYWDKTKAFLFYHAWKRYKEMEKERR